MSSKHSASKPSSDSLLTVASSASLPGTDTLRPDGVIYENGDLARPACQAYTVARPVEAYAVTELCAIWRTKLGNFKGHFVFSRSWEIKARFRKLATDISGTSV